MSASPLALELQGIRNPFRSGITRDAWDPDWVDVAEIHQAASDLVFEEVAATRRRGGGCGILLHGEPGSGKTHLLNRVRRWCVQEGVLFSGFRLQCGPQTIWRHLRREFVRDLLQKLPDGTTQLDRVLSGCGAERIGEVQDFQLASVLRRWQEGRFLHECAAWLRGDRLPETALRALGVTEMELDEEETVEDEARRVLKELMALAAPRPVVLALDQVEALQSDREDRRGLAVLGTAAAALRDESPNLVLVTCVQTGFLDELERAVSRADRDRLRERPAELQPLDERQARALLQARLEAEPAMRDHPRRREQPLWPFREDAIRSELMKAEAVTPRRLIEAARDLFEQLRGGAAARARGNAGPYLMQLLRTRIEQARSAPAPEGNESLLDGLRRLMPLTGWRNVEPRPQGIDLLLEKEQRRLAVVILNRPGLQGAAQRLRKIRANLPAGQVRLFRAAALPLSPKAVKAREELTKLEQAGGRLVRVSSEAMAALEACRTLLADAAAGDLHKDGETLGRDFVAQWLGENLPDTLKELVGIVDPEKGRSGREDGSELREALVELIREVKVTAVEDAAARLGVALEEVRRSADQIEDLVAAVGNPARVLFEKRGG